MSHRFGQCQLSGCHNAKHKIGKYCQRHRKALNGYGHPKGRPIDLNSILPWAVKARRVLNAHADTHPGIQLAVEELSRALREATERDKVAPVHFSSPRSQAATDRKVIGHFARLASQGVDALDVLTMIAAVALLDHDEAGRFPDTQAYQYGVARAVLQLVPVSAPAIGAHTLSAIGKYLADRYTALTAVVVRAVLEAEHQAANRRAAMSAPLQSPTTTPNTER